MKLKNNIQWNEPHEFDKKLETIQYIARVSNEYEEIKKKVDNLSLKNINNLDEQINNLAISIENCLELSNKAESTSLKAKAKELNMNYRILQNNYLTRKLDLTVKETNKRVNNITHDSLFSIASIFLGISFTSAAVTCFSNINSNAYLLFFVTIIFVAFMIIGVSSLILRVFDNKSKAIIVAMIIFFLFWLSLVIINPQIKINNDTNTTINNDVIK